MFYHLADFTAGAALADADVAGTTALAATGVADGTAEGTAEATGAADATAETEATGTTAEAEGAAEAEATGATAEAEAEGAAATSLDVAEDTPASTGSTEVVGVQAATKTHDAKTIFFITLIFPSFYKRKNR